MAAFLRGHNLTESARWGVRLRVRPLRQVLQVEALEPLSDGPATTTAKQQGGSVHEPEVSHHAGKLEDGGRANVVMMLTSEVVGSSGPMRKLERP